MEILTQAAYAANAILLIGVPAGTIFGCCLYGAIEGFYLK